MESRDDLFILLCEKNKKVKENSFVPVVYLFIYRKDDLFWQLSFVFVQFNK